MKNQIIGLCLIIGGVLMGCGGSQAQEVTKPAPITEPANPPVAAPKQPVCDYPSSLIVALSREEIMGALALSQGNDAEVSIAGGKILAHKFVAVLQGADKLYCKMPDEKKLK